MRCFLTLALFASFLLLAGCGGAPEDQLIGTWTIDAEAMKQLDEYQKASDAEKKMMDSMVKSMNMELTFTENQMTMSMEFMGQKNSEKVDYVVKSSEGNKLVLHGKDSKGVEKDVTCWVDGDKLTFDADGKKITLKRK